MEVHLRQLTFFNLIFRVLIQDDLSVWGITIDIKILFLDFSVLKTVFINAGNVPVVLELLSFVLVEEKCRTVNRSLPYQVFLITRVILSRRDQKSKR
jgi:hypothetical protein